MPRTGIEPARDLIPRGPKPRVSASSTTSATLRIITFFGDESHFFMNYHRQKYHRRL